MTNHSTQKLLLLTIVVFFSGCAAYAGLNYDQLFGEEKPKERIYDENSGIAKHYNEQVKPIIDNRCVVCHACYDAPCQLKMSSPEGIDRGAHKNLVYEGTRLLAANPTRLFEDAQTTEEWRDIGFSPILNEREQSQLANLEAGVMARMLTLKLNNPLPQDNQLEGFDFSTDRDQQCPTIEEMASYEENYPTWGMPYGMPALSAEEHDTLIQWLAEGANMSEPTPLTTKQIEDIRQWETFLNGDSLKQQLTSRYIYEHLFLSHLYFSNHAGNPTFFKLIRSATPPEKPITPIASRRPYDDPKVDRVYYRFSPVRGTIVDKTHMPYALNGDKLKRLNDLFINRSYEVSELPSYNADVAANPLTAFMQLPVDARFKFMLDNAQNTIMGFIKGPVCRGQLALNVINDRFWVLFLDPDMANIPEVNEFYASQIDNLKLPGELESNTLPLHQWVKYSKQQGRYLKAKSEFMNSWFKDGQHISTDVLWDGNGHNDNAALTVFRHFDSASVVKGLVGEPPKTAWILDYSLFERIHYLLVAGFDVYGNFGHQLITRMFMDFLRMEGESNFLALLPPETRKKELAKWYQNSTPQLSQFLQGDIQPFEQPTQVKYVTENHKEELYSKIKDHLSLVLSDRYEITHTPLATQSEKDLQTIDKLSHDGIYLLPQLTMVMIDSKDKSSSQLFTLIHNNKHSNISSLFNEDSNRLPKEDTLTLVKGIVGSYPAAYWSLNETEIPELLTHLRSLRTEEDYVKLLDRFAVRRSSDKFWPLSDKVHQWYQQDQPIEAGLLDYNRFQNR
ncbi:fatty acid cis/trans isomerase [Vibrio sp. Of7-15]|uniref:fatty acid cis/trans isomerase n=1 Tax=Vibrio sp. Of7-15 TaxID=2724879 RepID=UPI001EF257D0|nr:fatty acid cis/trans isomerase [Vibrio sp. Of7-15]MCG7496504.1 fatty acid cis/trans isomerase [Vibrio sp. Of7-15]